MNDRLERQIEAERRLEQESIAQQEFVQGLVQERQKRIKVPKMAWAFIGLIAVTFLGVIALFLMSFNPSTQGTVDKAIGTFKVF